jgi:hypothetical protein
MGTFRNWFSFVFAATCLLFPAAANAANSRDYEIPDVRVSSVQGDVRVSRGNKNTTDLNKPWEQAAAGLAIEKGFSLATGSGRAEIEFEGGSIVYLAEDSLLLVKELQEVDGGGTARLALVTGTATFSLTPVPDAVFLFQLETPTDRFEVRYPKKSFLRLESYLDGVAITPQADKGEDVANDGFANIHLAKGQSVFLRGGMPVTPTSESHSISAAEWDQWVSERETKYRATLARAAQAAGVDSGFPGLTELYAQGDFFPCGESETCWEPKLPLTQASSQTAQPPAASPQLSSPQVKAPAKGKPDVLTEDWVEGVCFPVWVHRVNRRDASGKMRTVSVTRSSGSPNWESYACSGRRFQFYRNHYVPVFERRRHHHHHDPHCPPVHWVKSHGAVGFVPAHPKDIPGKPPVNLSHGIFLRVKGRDVSFQHVDVRVADKVTVLRDAPREFRTDTALNAPRVDAPQIQAHFRDSLAPAGGLNRTHGETSAVRYDYKSHTFVRPGEASTGGAVSKPVAVAGLSSRGNLLGNGSGRGSDRGTNGSGYSGGGRTSGSPTESSRSSSNSGGGGRSSGSSSSGSSSSAGSASHSSGGSNSGGSSSSASAAPSSGASGGRPH